MQTKGNKLWREMMKHLKLSFLILPEAELTPPPRPTAKKQTKKQLSAASDFQHPDMFAGEKNNCENKSIPGEK